MARFFGICLFLITSFTVHAEPLIRYQYAPGEITQLTKQAITTLESKIAQILAIPDQEKNFKNTVLAIEEAEAQFGEEISAMDFMSSVSTQKRIRKASVSNSKKVSAFSVKLSTNEKIYKAILVAVKNTPEKQLTEIDKRLLSDILKGFKNNGMDLPKDKRKELAALKIELGEKSADFSNNIDEDTTSIDLSEKELNGVPADVIEDFKKNGDGTFKVLVNGPNFTAIMDNAHSADARQKILNAYENRAPQNIELLKQIIELRLKIAKLLGFNTWAEYAMQDRMAKSPTEAMDFLLDLKGKIAEKRDKDLALLLKFKQQADPSATTVNAWDVRYLENQYRKANFADEEVIKEYFPSDRVMAKIFEIYSTLLGVEFKEVANPEVWAPNVKLYEIREAGGKKVIAQFFTDVVPREGKYGHAAAFTLVKGRSLGRRYNVPVSAIVANFRPPKDGAPSLMKHDEVVTLFHEFGHIMHQVLTRAKYSSQSGTSVARDFVETPSQLLENWAWDPKILSDLSRNYKTGQPLAPELIQKIIAAKHFNSGYFYSRQLVFGLFDMALHNTNQVVDPVETYKRLYKEVVNIEALPTSLFAASFGHLMGYDAGYYGYLWSEVFADDVFTVFEKEGLLSTETGKRYRQTVLEKGDTVDAKKLLEEFLGREPSNKAFVAHFCGNSLTNLLH